MTFVNQLDYLNYIIVKLFILILACNHYSTDSLLQGWCGSQKVYVQDSISHT